MEPCWHRFTPAEGGARLAATAAAGNTLVTECGAFVATRLTHEEAYNIRGLLSEGKQRSVHISRSANVKPDTYELSILTDLKITHAVKYHEVLDWRQELETKEVLVCTSEVFRNILEDGILKMCQVNILVIDSCHMIYEDKNLQYIMQTYKKSDENSRPRILAITYPLFDSPKNDTAQTESADNANNQDITEPLPSENNALVVLNGTDTDKLTDTKPPLIQTLKDLNAQENVDDFDMYEKLEYKIEQLEQEFCCKMDLAEDIDGCKRISGPTTKPKEILIEYGRKSVEKDIPKEYIELDNYMRECVGDAMYFLEDHRHDPTEIYGEELYDEFKNIPNPTIEPRQIIREFLYVLEELGPYAADKAAFSLLIKLEKLKIKVPYERHFLLLRLCTTTFVKIRCFAENILSLYDDWERIKLFSTPKLLRLVEILEQFTPPDLKESIENGTYVKFERKNDFDNFDSESVNSQPKNDESIKSTSEMLNVLDKCDFTTLGNKIEDRLNVIEGNLKDLDDFCKKEENQIALKTHLRIEKSLFSRRSGRSRARRPPRNNPRVSQMTHNDALCGVAFVTHPLMAKILFMCIVDISRVCPSISYINSQYCAVEPMSESKESQRQGRRHEEVLKKFRMHECNLLLTTSALEEGIDLPRCNLVLRWDVPPSYRSYVLCRGRARAVRSGAALLSANEQTDTLMHRLAVYMELDQEKVMEEVSRFSMRVLNSVLAEWDCTSTFDPKVIITRKCGCGVQDEPPSDEETHADSFNPIIKPYSPNDTPNTCICIKNKIKKDIASSMKRTISDSENDAINEISEYNILDLKHMKLTDDCDTISDSKSDDKSDSKNDDKSDSKNDDQSDDKSVNENSDKCMCNANSDDSVASVDLNSAIALINRYCAKLPSDTFTRLAPQWWIERVRIPDETRDAFICTLRLPLNCPVKYNIVGHPMPTRVLARRMVALQACRILHKSGELDHQLMPIGKENFKAMELDNVNPIQDTLLTENDSARPGTTKRRQYYYKRTACAFTDCQPVIDTSDTEIEPQPNSDSTDDKQNSDSIEDKSEVIDKEINTEENSVKYTGTKRNMLYAIESSLWCALPERYNTRGRKLHSPQHANQALAILMAREEPTNLQIPAFPVYTRSGEVRVSVQHVPDADVRLSPRRGRLVRRFMHFVFTEVLRVRRRGMTLESEGTTRNDYYIVPTIKTTRPDGTQATSIDWAFLEQIYAHTEQQNLIDLPVFPRKGSEDDSSIPLKNPLLKNGEVFVFDAEQYKEAVVTPWYRNQDQPQFFLVAEICSHLTPDSAFPSPTHATFRSYYQSKYKVELTQPKQPLLDVDHTSARLNLLTPRYVNRKGVALPVSSERTRRAKRDRLDQKQILVPELCTVHPFAAPLWFATVALPCVLYRINALLIADEIRRAVAIDVGLGIPKIDDTTMPGFQWPPLDFGWCLAEVLNADAEKTDKKKDGDSVSDEPVTEKRFIEDVDDPLQNGVEDDITEVCKEKTINEILQEEHDQLNQDDAESGFEIGTWSNEMASSIPDDVDDIYDEWSEPLPPNLTFCTSANGGVNWCEPVQKPKPEYNPTRNYTMADSDCSYMSSDFDSDDSDFDVDTDTDNENGFGSSKAVNASLGVRIEYKTAHEAEAVDIEPPQTSNPSPQRDATDEMIDRAESHRLLTTGHADHTYIEKFKRAVEAHKQTILNGQLITKDKKLCDILPETKDYIDYSKMAVTDEKFQEIFPYKSDEIKIVDGQVCIESIERNKRVLLEKLKKSLNKEEVSKLNCFFMKDIDIDASNYVNEKIANVGFDSREKYVEKVLNYEKEFKPYYDECRGQNGKEFDFDYQPDLDGHPGPSPSVILQALTMSNANDGINLERLETIGDSFLKFAITAYLYCAHPTVHEGKLSHMRSKQVSNLNLYRLGRSARLGARMIASKFEPHDNWLPPCHKAPPSPHEQHEKLMAEQDTEGKKAMQEATGCYIPYNLITQHSIPDKSIADCVEALIGAYLLECGPRGALLFMAWLGISVLPHHRISLPKPKEEVILQHSEQSKLHASSSNSISSDEFELESPSPEPKGSGHFGPAGARRPYRDEHGNWYQIVYGELKAPPSPLLRYIQDPEGELERMLSGYDALEDTLQYRFNDRSLLLQALTHASHHKNTLTDCYQRLEFLGDAILDYLITRHLYEDPRRHSPGALTDLRSALVNNTIFATLAVRHGFHKYFRHMSPGLNEVLIKYVKIQEENGHSISEEHYLIQEDELEQAEDVEVPKALGDLFESIAGAIFLDSGMSLGAVWGSYVRLMGAELEAFSAAAPKSPVRELLEAEPDTAKFSKPERLADGRRVRVCVEVFGRGTFKGVGRNYRIAKGTAARCALRHLKKHRR